MQWLSVAYTLIDNDNNNTDNISYLYSAFSIRIIKCALQHFAKMLAKSPTVGDFARLLIYASSQWSKCCGLTRGSQVSPQHILTTVMTHIVVDKSTDNAKTHSICFLTAISTSKKMFFFQSVTKNCDKIVTQTMTFSQSDWFITQNESF